MVPTVNCLSKIQNFQKLQNMKYTYFTMCTEANSSCESAYQFMRFGCLPLINYTLSLFMNIISFKLIFKYPINF